MMIQVSLIKSRNLNFRRRLQQLKEDYLFGAIFSSHHQSQIKKRITFTRKMYTVFGTRYTLISLNVLCAQSCCITS